MGGPSKSQALGISIVKQLVIRPTSLLREELSGQVLRNQGRALSSEAGRPGERCRSPSQVSGMLRSVPWNTGLGLDYLGLDHSVQKQLK